ncbi:pyruvate decarboxylase, partial [Acetobacter sacchari]|nr:pyruvate decarboxylase [Acetobacter sacchari]
RRIGGGVAENTMEAPAKGGKLTREHIQRTLQSIVTSETTIFGETGDSWFNVARTKLPRGARVEYEMQWGHIGWSVPAMFGYAVATPE